MKKPVFIQKGFALIEIILTVSLISMISAVGVSTYKDFAATKTVSTAADEVANVMQSAKSKAIAQVKPNIAACNTGELVGYQVVTCPGTCTTTQKYQLQVICGITATSLSDYFLPTGVVFSPSTQQVTLFRVLSGATDISSPLSIVYQGKTKYVGVSKEGVIIASAYSPTTPTPTMTSTPTPTSILPTNTPTPGPAAPIVNITPSPSPIAINATSVITWSTTNAHTCTGTGGAGSWAGAKAVSGSFTTPALGSTTIFTLSCSGPGGVTQNSATVTVMGPPVVTISASPTFVSPGGTSTLSWSATNSPTSCTASGSWSGTKGVTGPATTAAINAQATYTLTCTGPGGTSAPSSAVVVVKQQKLLNTGFESGASQTDWVIQQTDATAPDGPICQESTTYCTNTTPDGVWYLKLGGLIATQYDDQVYQLFALPATTTAVTLSFKYRIISAETTTTVANDNFYPTVKDANGVNITGGSGFAPFSNLDETPSTTWVQSPTYDLTSILTSYFGQSIRLRFMSNNNTTLKTNMLIDQVFVNVTY